MQTEEELEGAFERAKGNPIITVQEMETQRAATNSAVLGAIARRPQLRGIIDRIQLATTREQVATELARLPELKQASRKTLARARHWAKHMMEVLPSGN